LNLPTAEIVCLGNELLIGVTINTNSSYVGEELTKLGFEVRRITCIRDDVDLAVAFFHELFERKPNLVIITGGLGPTYDDIQLEVISKSTNLTLIENEIAIEQIKEYYAKKNLHLTKERRKMGKLPNGAEVLKNNIGGAPGCYIKYEDIDMYCLPGVPTEMKDIFSSIIIPRLKMEARNQIYEIKFQIFNCFESELAPYLNEISKKYSKLYIKSHPEYKDIKGIVIHISGTGKNAKEEVTKVKDSLQEIFIANLPSIKIKEILE